MPVSERQITEFADHHLWKIPFDTSPRHLAGPGDPRHVTHGLAAAGWTRASSDPLSPKIVLHSPDHRTSLRFNPYASDWWVLRAEPTDTSPGWYAHFGELLPGEILGSLTDALHTPPPAEAPDPWQTLTAASWLPDDQGIVRSSDGMCRVEPYPLDRSEPMDWRVVAHERGYGYPDGRRIWSAWFNSRTPVHLVNTFVTALVDTAPLQREMYARTAHCSATHERSPLTPQQVVNAHTTRLNALSAQARAAKRHKPTTAVAPAQPGRTTTPIRR
ncbi:DUF317 domain-containing protein [Streptomyces sp. NPDC059255]|uniref:DUF317 domain-containing protein n=1 Tax=Streptomyces sp. NPDC059255 TaxID=3346793 RepID=UPI0036C1F521